MVFYVGVLYPYMEQKHKKTSTVVFYILFQNGYVLNLVPNLEQEMTIYSGKLHLPPLGFGQIADSSPVVWSITLHSPTFKTIQQIPPLPLCLRYTQTENADII